VIDRIEHEGDSLCIVWRDGSVSRFHAVWLRDNGGESRHPVNGQRLFDVADLPEAVAITAAEVDASGRLQVHFSPDEHCSWFEPAWLRAHADSQCSQSKPGLLWDCHLTERLPWFDYTAVTTDAKARADWLQAVVDYGFALLRGVPCAAGQVLPVAALFGYVRETNYGRLFDVRAEAQPINLAYSGAGLLPHTDNPYRDPVPGLQLLHCLENNAEGGESILVDGFRAAALLRREAPEQFRLLTNYCVPFRFGAAGVDLQARAPLIEIDDNEEIIAVRYNNRSIAPLDLAYDLVPLFYQAYRHFAEILRRPELAVIFKMTPGDLLLLDNRRVLHGRTAFSGQGKRHLQGCYADSDGLLSTLRTLYSQFPIKINGDQK